MRSLLKQKNIGWLVAIYVAIVCSITLRSYVESTHFVTPDSDFYLRVAENINNGKGMIAPQIHPFDNTTPESHFAVWPVGYPVMIAVVSKVLGVSVLVASKLVNLLFLGFIFILLHVWFKNEAWFPALYFFSFAKMEVFSYTWSEGCFLFFVLLLCYWLSRMDTKYVYVKVGFCLVCLFLLRYAGVVYFAFVGLFSMVEWLIGDKQKAKKMIATLFLAAIPCLLYLCINQWRSGYYSGLDRFTPDEMSNWFAISSSVVGLANEFLFASHYFLLKNNLTWIFISCTLLQLLFYWVLFRAKRLIVPPFFDNSSRILIFSGVVYIVAVAVLQRLHACSYFDYRILSPFSTTLFVALFWSLSKARQKQFFESNKKLIVGIMVLCFLMNLPKQYLVDLLF